MKRLPNKPNTPHHHTNQPITGATAMPSLSPSALHGGRRLLLQCLLLLALTAAAEPDTSSSSTSGGGAGRLHPHGWYLERFRIWADNHNVSLPYDADGSMGRAFRRRLAIWSENKCVGGVGGGVFGVGWS